MRCPAHGPRSRAARRVRARRSPVLSSRRRLDLVLLLLLRLHVTLLACRTAKQLLGLLLSKPALGLGRLPRRRLAARSTAPTATTAALLLLAKRELVIPFRVHVPRAQQQCFLVDREGRIE